MLFAYFKQYDAMDCGPTCLRMVAKHYGKNFSLQSLREKTQIGKEGVSLLGISEAAEATGFRTVAAKLTIEQLVKDAALPAILHWDQEHFVVVYKIKKNRIFIADPGLGLTQYTINDFKQHWISDKEEGKEEGVALLLEPAPAFFNAESEDDNQQVNNGLAFKNIFNYILPHKRLMLQLLLGLGIGHLLPLISPFYPQSV